jgi:hypothetical protein
MLQAVSINPSHLLRKSRKGKGAAFTQSAYPHQSDKLQYCYVRLLEFLFCLLLKQVDLRIVLIVPYRLTVCAQAWLQCMLAGILILFSSQTGGCAYRTHSTVPSDCLCTSLVTMYACWNYRFNSVFFSNRWTCVSWRWPCSSSRKF